MKIIDGIIPRPHFLNQILPFVNKQLIKVLTGQRRVGKSYILRSIESEIRKSDANANFIHIDLEDFAFSHIKDAATLHDEISGKLASKGRNYIFIDEIQEIRDFDKVVRSLNLNPENDIYITGSNSAMLSSEIGSRLAGRCVEFRIHPLSFTEFLEFHRFENSDEALDAYLRFGGMPYLRNLPESASWSEYLSGLTDAIVYRDIVGRHSIRNNDFLQRLVLFLADNIGRIFTAKRIADYLKSQHISSSVAIVQTYAEYIREACLVNKVRRWDIEGKRYFAIGEKYFFEDIGIRNAVIGYRPADIGGIMENAVYNKLAFDGYETKTGSFAKGKEIDFVAERDGERKYIQVAVNVDDRATYEREFGNLMDIPDNYEKIVVTLRDSAPNTREGVRMLSLREFLSRP